VVATTICPNERIDSDQNQIDYCLCNRMIREYAQVTPGVVLADFAVPYCLQSYKWSWPRKASSTAPYNTPADASYDGTHPSNYGARLLGKCLYDILAPLVPPTPLLVASNADPQNLLPSGGCWVGTTGAHNANNKSSGDLGTGWTCWAENSGGTETAVCSKVARRDNVPGQWQQVVISGGVTNPMTLLYQNVTTGFSVGDTLVGLCEWESDDDWTAASIQQVNIRAWCRDSGGVGKGSGMSQYWASQNGNCCYRAPSGVMMLEPFVVPSSTTQIQFSVRLGFGAGTIRLGRCSLQKVLS
jgi:hypothetical protein